MNQRDRAIAEQLLVGAQVALQDARSDAARMTRNLIRAEQMVRTAAETLSGTTPSGPAVIIQFPRVDAA